MRHPQKSCPNLQIVEYTVSKKCARAELRISASAVNSLIANGSLLVAMTNKLKKKKKTCCMVIAMELRFCKAKIDAWLTFWILDAPRLMVFIQSW